jgi:hypothetical protein
MMRDTFPSYRWAIHATDDADDLILQIYVPKETDRVTVRHALELGNPLSEDDTSETHRMRYGYLSIIEDMNDIRSNQVEGIRREA